MKTIEEGKQRIKDGKWTREDLRNWREWNEKKGEQAAIEDQTRIDGKKQAAIARKTEEQNIDQAAIENTERMRKLAEYVKIAQDSLNPE